MREPRSRARGAASLVVVMVLFFVMMTAAAFNSRSLVFEQKTSANQYRYTQAFEAGEAGLQWAQAMLNGGSVDASCNPDATQTSFRERYLATDFGTGRITPRLDMSAGCVKTAAGWRCSCPAAGAPVLAAPNEQGNLATFTVRFFEAPKPGMVRVQANGCSGLGSPCVTAVQRSDAHVELATVLALSGGLRAPPSAALTARGDVTLNGIETRFTNADEEANGVTINAGGAIAGTPRLTTTPGSLASRSMVEHDGSLSALNDPTHGNRMFVSFFGTDAQAFQRLGAVQRVECGGDCSATLQAAYNHGYRLFWLADNAIVGGSTVLGSPTDPVLLVAERNLQVTDTARVHGMVYSTAAAWNNGDGSGQLHGAAIAEGSFSAGGSTHFVYDPEILAHLRMRTGTFARVAGSWSDTRP